MNPVTATEIKVIDYKDTWDLHRFIYMGCRDCHCVDHIARVAYYVEIEKKTGKIIMDEISFEFNMNHVKDPAHGWFNFSTPWDKLRYPFYLWRNRIKGAWDLVRGKPVDFCAEFSMDLEGSVKLAEMLKDTKSQMEYLAKKLTGRTAHETKRP